MRKTAGVRSKKDEKKRSIRNEWHGKNRRKYVG
jgi:hypothetical protein